MNTGYWSGLQEKIDYVYRNNPSLVDHRNQFPWLVGALGRPEATIWFVAENPSLTQIERVQNPDGGLPTPEAQWWASRGDKLFREMLVKYRFKNGLIDSPNGWQCYITNVIKEADYTKNWRDKSQDARNRAAEIWSEVLAWELEQAHPKLVILMGKQTTDLLNHLVVVGCIKLPRIKEITHYAYIGQRAQGHLGPMHPERIKAYAQEFSRIREIYDRLK